jgi:hypothetical protein
VLSRESHGKAEDYPLRIREPDWYAHRMLKGKDVNLRMPCRSMRSRDDTSDLRADTSCSACGMRRYGLRISSAPK